MSAKPGGLKSEYGISLQGLLQTYLYTHVVFRRPISQFFSLEFLVHPTPCRISDWWHSWQPFTRFFLHLFVFVEILMHRINIFGGKTSNLVFIFQGTLIERGLLRWRKKLEGRNLHRGSTHDYDIYDFHVFARPFRTSHHRYVPFLGTFDEELLDFNFLFRCKSDSNTSQSYSSKEETTDDEEAP